MVVAIANDTPPFRKIRERVGYPGFGVLPAFPGSFAAAPKLFKVLFVTECVHRLPEAVMKEGVNLAFGD